MPRFRSFGVLAACLVSLGALTAHAAETAKPAAAKPVELDMKLFSELGFRALGPTNMGGRVSDIAAVESDPATMFVATGTGGMFKTTNMGTTWTPVFEKEVVASVGAVAVWQKNPSLVWAGTGEANSRNSSSWGRGVYRSEDGGSSWKCVGLEATSAIARVVTDPADSNVAYVAALGRLWGENPERGVFRTRDGGKSWQHVLKVDARTGAVDLVMDPSDARTLYAAMYARRRTAWSYSGVSATGGIWKSTDGGEHWTKLANGLPARTGRIGLAVYRKNPRVVYAVIESDEGGRLNEFEETSRAGGVFRSDDAGASWKRISAFTPRSFYFSQIRVQPDDSTRVYLLGTDLYVSDDGGVTYRANGADNVHPDCHAMWISPSNGRHVVMGTDGGVYLSHDRIANWDFLNTLPIGEFYNVATDLREPFYRVYGGLQDNQSWGGPIATRFEASMFGDGRIGGIATDDWYVLGGGDGFHVAADPTNPDLVYYESQGGSLLRQDLSNGRQRVLRPSNNEGEPVFRYNWNTPFFVSPHDPTVLYMAAQYVFRLTRRGDHWERISDDLTTQDPRRMMTGGSGAEQHCTIVALAESPKTAGVLWAGTDDGKLWVTPDGGAHWNDVTANLKGVPVGLYVSSIEASHFDANVAYVTIDGHRSDVFAPFVFVTRDQGRTWRSLAATLPKDHTAKRIREDLTNPSLLFAGTEFGLFVSFDAGAKWLPWKDGLPTVAIDDIHIHPRDRDLVLATHGRSLYAVDGIHVLEALTAGAVNDTVTFAAPRKAWVYETRTLGGKWGQRQWLGKNPPKGAWFDYFLPRDLDGGVSLTVKDSTGRVVRSLTGPGKAGFHRVVWDLAPGEAKDRIARGEWFGQPYVRPGRYSVALTAGKAAVRERSFQVEALPGMYPDEL
ncbi:MAG: glycosyl hydrolase [Candidatus Eisenbacteria bacterium]